MYQKWDAFFEPEKYPNFHKIWFPVYLKSFYLNHEKKIKTLKIKVTTRNALKRNFNDKLMFHTSGMLNRHNSRI